MAYVKNVVRLAKSRKMWWPYLQWVAARAVFRKPRVHLGRDAFLREWISFSEYFYFLSGISARELCFLRRVREEAGKGECVGFDVGANVGLFTCTINKSILF